MNKIAFFGTSDFSVNVLEKMKELGVMPNLIVCGEDKPQGRNLIITPPATKTWAQKNNIPFIQPKSLKTDDFLQEIKKENWDIFIVASYGKIIPKNILNIPKGQTINIHPSLLPKLRGASPIPQAILEEEKTGVSIMLLDEEMDHGPIIIQKEIPIKPWPPKVSELKKILAEEGATLLVYILPKWLSGEIQPIAQKHDEATYTKKIEKSDGEINLNDNPEKNWRKIQAYTPWPSAYFFIDHKDKKMRVIIKEAQFENGILTITKVLPEGRKEITWKEFETNFL